MARRNGNLLSGGIGPLTYKVVKDKQYVTKKKKKGTTRQTKASVKSASTFGFASRLGTQLRMSLYSVLKNRVDINVSGRSTGALNLICQQTRDSVNRKFYFESNSFNSLVGLDLNEDAPIKKWLLMTPDLNFGQDQLSIQLPKAKPSVVLRFPKGASACRLTIAVACFALLDGLRVIHPLRQDLLIGKDDENFAADNWNYSLPAGCLCIVTTSVVYLANAKSVRPLMDLRFNPTTISGAVILPGTFNRTAEFPWIEMDELKFD